MFPKLSKIRSRHFPTGLSKRGFSATQICCGTIFLLLSHMVLLSSTFLNTHFRRDRRDVPRVKSLVFLGRPLLHLILLLSCIHYKYFLNSSILSSFSIHLSIHFLVFFATIMSILHNFWISSIYELSYFYQTYAIIMCFLLRSVHIHFYYPLPK